MIDAGEERCAYCGGPFPELTPEQAKSQAGDVQPRRYCCRSHKRKAAENRRGQGAGATWQRKPIPGCKRGDKRVWIDPFAAQRFADEVPLEPQFVYRCKTGERLHYHLTSDKTGQHQRYDKPGDDTQDKLVWTQAQRQRLNASTLPR